MALGVLAVFQAGDGPEAATHDALQSAMGIVARLAEIRSETAARQCDCSIGIAYGRVTYGNVGSRERLDFTVIGQEANIAARLGDYGKKLGHRIVVSEDILSENTDHVELGALDLHNVSRPVPSFAIPPQYI